MTSRPVIFISAVSKELKTARGLAARLVHSLGYEPKDQDMARTEHGSLRGVLRKWIDQSEGVIQLVGKCHGSEPREPDPEFGRVSYTQFEALYARKRGKPVWYFFLGEGFKPDPHEEEAIELRELQRAYSHGVRETGDIRHRFTNEAELENCIHRIHDHLDELRREWQDEQRRARRFRVFAGIGLLLLLAIGIAGIQFGWWVKKGTDAIKKDTAEIRADAAEMKGTLGKTEQKVDLLHEDNAKLLQALRDLPQALARTAQSEPRDDENARRARTYSVLEAGLHLPAGKLEKDLPKFAEQLLLRADTSALDRANALFATQKFAEAEVQALIAKDQALATTGKPVRDAIEALGLAGHSAGAQTEYARALEHFRAAAALTNQERDPTEWARVQSWIGSALFADGQYSDAESMFRQIGIVRHRTIGPEHPDTLDTRNKLANALRALGQDTAAEREYRAVLEARRRVLGEEDPDTLQSRNNWAAALQDLGRYEAAEQELQSLLTTIEHLYPADDVKVLMIRNNLATVLSRLRKNPEALNQYRAILAIEEHTLGPDHLSTLTTRNNLANALSLTGNHDEAIKEHRAVVDAHQRLLRPEHPTVLQSRDNLAAGLDFKGEYVEAENEHRAVLAIRERVQGARHRDVFQSCLNLAACLLHQNKLEEALGFMQRAEQGFMKVLGPDHPDTRNAAAGRKRIEAALKER